MPTWYEHPNTSPVQSQTGSGSRYGPTKGQESVVLGPQGNGGLRDVVPSRAEGGLKAPCGNLAPGSDAGESGKDSASLDLGMEDQWPVVGSRRSSRVRKPIDRLEVGVCEGQRYKTRKV